VCASVYAAGGVATLHGQSSDAACTMCHGVKTLTATRQGRKIPLYVDGAKLQASAHGALSCSACHKGFNPGAIPHAAPVQKVRCESCHATDEIKGFGRSVHAQGGAVTCKSCHGAHDVVPVKSPRSGVNRMTVAATCGKCHAAEAEAFKVSEHARFLDRDAPQSPNCVICHGSHKVVAVQDEASPLNRKNEPGFCLGCHLNDPAIRGQVGFSERFMSGYLTTVHGKALAAGNLGAATCGDCHGVHDEQNVRESTSRINKWNLADTCGKCHTEEAAAYKDSTHGMAVARGSAESPTCTSCHGDHHIYSPQDPRSTVSRANIAEEVCANCHNSVKLSQKYGIAADRFASFADSFHGLASRGGSLEVANCASCHGVHNIKPSSDPDSTISAKNLTTTCGNCHPGANENFARGLVHVQEAGETREGVLFWIRTGYLAFIAVVIGLMFIHNLLDFLKRTKRRFDVRWGRRPLSRYSPAQYVRMTALDRLQHAGLLVSFLLLAMTGFMLRFPDAWWVNAIRAYWPQFFEVRGIVHRAAAVSIMSFSLLHVIVLVFTRHGRRLAVDLFPKWRDVKDFFINVRYLSGWSQVKPRFDRFGYIEKAEYWALVWGMVIMFATGVFLWFNNFFINHFTKLAWDVSRTIHFYEALLATLAIVVWHFYYVIFNPSIYPMNTAWITGKISEKEMAEEHPLELERLREEAGRGDAASDASTPPAAAPPTEPTTTGPEARPPGE
jgi:formate dehydrogenase gamma subunit